MDGDNSEGLVVVLAVLFLVSGIISLILGIGLLFAGIAAVFGLGILSNIFLRLFPNLLDWVAIDEDWIWFVIIGLAIAPVGIGFLFITMVPLISWIVDVHILLVGFFSIIAYLVWLAGYLWGWFDPRFELGSADVVMASEMTLLVTKAEMLWTYIKLKLDLFASDLGLL